VTAKRILREERQAIRVAGDGEDGLTAHQLKRLIATWRATTGRDPARAFEYGPGLVKPTNWVGSIAASDVLVEVVPRGALGLSQADRDRLDQNLGEMLHLGLSHKSLDLGTGEVNPHGSRFERAVEALCDHVRHARRIRVLRRYQVREEISRSSRGQLRFPAQAVISMQRPGFAACRWVELSEDTVENRFLKAALALSQRRVRGSLRRRVEETLLALGTVPESACPALEYERIELARLPPEYAGAIELAKSILEGSGTGIFVGTLASRSEVLFLPALFQSFVGYLVQQFARERGLTSNIELRGRRLSRWHTGPFAGKSLVELIPDAELSTVASSQPQVVIDAKWKVIRPDVPSLGIGADDIHQMLAYAVRFDCTHSVLVYPWLGKRPPFAQPPVMEVGPARATAKIAILCVPLLWSEVREVVASLSEALDRLAES
jgi:5-methylcytosine-specific restriction enzyme subunit McrC